MIREIKTGEIYYSSRDKKYFVVGSELKHMNSKRTYEFLNEYEFKGYNKVVVPTGTSPQHDIVGLISHLNSHGYELRFSPFEAKADREITKEAGLFSIDDL
jgi:hypothetical protein